MFTRLVPILFVIACNDNGGKPSQSQAAPPPPPSTPAVSVTASAPPAPTAEPAQKVELEISSVGDTMTFDKAALTVPAKSEVHLVFHNNAKLDALPHNWVLVSQGKEAQVAADGLAIGVSAGYLPKSDDVLASTPLTPPKGTSEVTFTAPKYAGKYPYICTVPGHYVMMKGVLTVTTP
jgi:azurin